MAYALVGTIGTVAVGSTGTSVSPVFGTSENRVNGNLLICWVAGGGTATLPTVPAGWSTAKQQAGTSCSASIFYKIAAGLDSAPVIAAVTSTLLSARLGEFSGGIGVSPLDAIGGVAGTTSSQVATCTSISTDSPELLIYCGSLLYSVAATKTLTASLNSGRTAVDVSSSALTTVDHYDVGYAINATNNAVADAYTLAFTTTNITGAALAAATFKLPSHLSPGRARHRIPRFSGRRGGPSRGRF